MKVGILIMKAKRSIFILLVIILSILIAIPVLAQTCIRSGCGQTVYLSYGGLTDYRPNGYHWVGGFLGIGSKRCDLSTRYSIYDLVCGAGHNNGQHLSPLNTIHSLAHN